MFRIPFTAGAMLLAAIVLTILPIAQAGEDSALPQLIKELSGQGPAMARSPAQLEAAYRQVIEALITAPQTRDTELEKILVRAGAPGAEPQRRAAVAAVLACLAKTDQVNPRVWLLRQLALVGRDEAVQPLAALLQDPSEAVRHYALRALETNPSAEAGRRLAAALGNSGSPAARVAIINAVARRRDTAAVAVLVSAARDSDSQVAAAAVTALGNIATPDAAEALSAILSQEASPLRPMAERALLLTADRCQARGERDAAARLYRQGYRTAKEDILRMAALRGLAITSPQEAAPLVMEALNRGDPRSQAAAVRLLLEMPGGKTTEAALAMLPALPPAVRPLMLEALLERASPGPGESALRAAALEAATSPEQHLSAAAVRALASIGMAADVPLLAQLAATGGWQLRETAARSLIAMRARGVDEGVVRLLQNSDTKTRVAMIRVAVARRAAGAARVLLQLADSGESQLRLDACKALQALADPATISGLVALLLKSRPGEEREILERAIAASCRKIADPQRQADAVLAALDSSDTAARCMLLPALGRIGSPKVLEAIHAAAKDGDPNVRDAAVRGLANWPDASVVRELLQLAETADQPHLRLLTLRAAVRVITLPGGAPAAQTVVVLRNAMQLAQRPDEKVLVLSRASAVRSPETLLFVLEFLPDPQLQPHALPAARHLAEALRFTHPEQARSALERLLSVARDEKLRQHLERILGEVK